MFCSLSGVKSLFANKLTAVCQEHMYHPPVAKVMDAFYINIGWIIFIMASNVFMLTFKV